MLFISLTEPAPAPQRNSLTLIKLRQLPFQRKAEGKKIQWFFFQRMFIRSSVAWTHTKYIYSLLQKWGRVHQVPCSEMWKGRHFVLFLPGFPVLKNDSVSDRLPLQMALLQCTVVLVNAWLLCVLVLWKSGKII